MYRLIRQACLSSPLLRDLDYFQESKQSAYNCSLQSIKALSLWMMSDATHQEHGLAEAKRERTFELLLQVCARGLAATPPPPTHTHRVWHDGAHVQASAHLTRLLPTLAVFTLGQQERPVAAGRL